MTNYKTDTNNRIGVFIEIYPVEREQRLCFSTFAHITETRWFSGFKII